MKKIPILFVLIMLFSISCEKEVSELPEVQADAFIKFLGNYMADEARDVVTLEDGGYAICGTVTVPDTGSRMFLIITDEYGNPMPGFPTYYTVDDRESGGTALVSKKGGSGGFLLCGWVERPKPSGTGMQMDMLIVKTSNEGVEHWTKVYGSAEDEKILHGTLGLSSGFMLAGYQENVNGEQDIMIMGLEEDGDSIELEFLFNKPEGSADARANHIINAGDTYLAVCTYDKVVGEGTDILVLNFDDELAPNDEVIQGNYDEYGKCIVNDTLNKYIVLGSQIKEQTGLSEILVYSVEKRGWVMDRPKLIGTISEIGANLEPEEMIRVGPGKFTIVGTRKVVGQDEDPEDVPGDIFLQFLEFYQEKDRILFGNSGDQRGMGIDLATDGGLVICGSNGDEQGGNSMITLIKTDDKGRF